MSSVLPTMAITIASSYIIILITSYLLYSFHFSNLIVIYKTQSLAAAISEYSWWIIGWLVLGSAYFYLSWLLYVGQRKKKQDNNCHAVSKYSQLMKYDKIIICVILTIIYLHSIHVISNAVQSNNSLYSIFKTGQQQKNANLLLIPNLSWPGWQYYAGDNYFGQTRDRLQHSRGKLMVLLQYQDMLIALKSIHDGIYSTRSWLLNHRMYYDILYLGQRSVGLLFLLTCWALNLYILKCQKKLRSACCVQSVLFTLFWFAMLVFMFLAQMVQSLIALNSHSVCLPQPNSGNINIIINSKSVELITSLHLNVIQDPNQIYSKVCESMQVFYEKPVETDRYLVKSALGLIWTSFMLIMLIEIIKVTYTLMKEKTKENNLSQQTIEQKQLVRINNQANSKKNRGGYESIQQEEQ